MSGDIISFLSEVEKRHVPDVTEKPSDHQYLIELEHEIAELREALADKDLEFRRYRARQSRPVRKVAVRKNMKRGSNA
jgi:hypothetical protein